MRRIVLVAVFLLGACGPGRIEDKPVLPALEGMEPAVAARITDAHARVTSEPSAANWARFARVLHAHDLVREAIAPYVVAAAHSEMPEKFELLYLGGHAAYKPDPDRAIALFEQAARSARTTYPCTSASAPSTRPPRDGTMPSAPSGAPTS